VPAEELLPERLRLAREDAGDVGGRHQPVAPRELRVELAGRPAGVADESAQLGARRREQAAQRVLAAGRVHALEHARRALRRLARPRQHQHLPLRDRPAEEHRLFAPLRLLELGQQRGEAPAERPVDHQAEAAARVVLEQHDHALLEEARDLGRRDQEGAGRGLARARRRQRRERHAQRERSHPRWYSPRKAARQSA
jgi:hypothetical protein